VQPDLLFISNERAEIITHDNVRGAPDLVVEILSPTTADRDRTIKLDMYTTHGVKEYWMVDPDSRTVIVLLRGESRFEVSGIYGEDQILCSPTLEGFTVALWEILQEDE
ncbi:MAG: Uma2 family endonuclease, partial [Caldilineaceae bacterium]|nr:Uma2 family endonuclease [Caldilineaceae bacterium]